MTAGAYSINAAAMAKMAAPLMASWLPAPPGAGTSLASPVGDAVGVMGEPVGVTEAVPLWPPVGVPEGRLVPYDALEDEVEVPLPAPICLKFAQAMRVLLARWTTMERSPK